MSWLSEILADSPSAAYPINEAAGTTGSGSVLDASGNAVNGTPSSVTFGVTGPVTGVTAGRFARASSSRISTGSTFAAITTANKFTLEAFVKSSFTSGYMAVWGSQPASGAALALYVNFGSGSVGAGRMELAVVNTASTGRFVDYNLNSGVTDGAWHHVAVTGDLATDTYAMYLDGAALGTLSKVGSAVSSFGGPLTQSMAIGRREGLNDGLWEGDICLAALFPSVLSPTRILAHYNAGLSTGIAGGVLAALQEMGAI